MKSVSGALIGSLIIISNAEGDSNGNGKRSKKVSIGKTAILPVHHAFFAVVARLKRETSVFTFCGGREHIDNNFLFSFP